LRSRSDLRLKTGIAGNAPDCTVAVCDIQRATIALRAIVVGHILDYQLGEGQCLGIVGKLHDAELFGLGRAVIYREVVDWQ
jgi:hypothetical protein